MYGEFCAWIEKPSQITLNVIIIALFIFIMFFIIVYFIFHWKYTAKENNIFQRNKFPQENIVKYYLLHYYEHMFIIILSLNVLKPQSNNIYGSNKEKETSPDGSLFWRIQAIRST
ncbi:hypothetical protein SDC9_167292 [bioreactor metagenome]|uniref:Uncharacterized protein n=1 Tax=bioreactor metagenome TaxID=1076179 RepID=A0A645FZE3_9ZZZZ